MSEPAKNVPLFITSDGQIATVSLRDWFAGTALYTAEIKRNVMTFDDLARNAYEIADAMIAERAKTK